MRIEKKYISKKLSELHNLEAEQSVLGILILDDEEASQEIFTYLTVEDFYSEAHQKIFSVIKTLFLKGFKIDLVSVIEAYERQFGTKDANEAMTLLTICMNSIIGSSNYAQIIKVVKDYSNLRKIENICYLGQDLVKSGKTADTVSELLQVEISKVSDSEIVNECEQVAETAQKAFEKFKKRANGEFDEFGIETGFKVLDRCLWGLQKSDLTIVAARAGVGKTAFALNVINKVAVKDKKKVAFFSLEMPKNQIIERLFSLGCDISNYELKKGNVHNNFKNLKEYSSLLKDSNLFIDDDSTNTVPKMLLKAKRLQRKEGLDLIVVDYLQFIKPQEKSGNRFQDVGEIARSLKSMARELNVPLLVLCQLNRQLDNEDREPTLADLRESGEIENNADIVMFLNSKSEKTEEIKKIDLIIGKFRNGALKKIRMTYKGDTFKFDEVEKIKNEITQSSMELTPIEDESMPF